VSELTEFGMNWCDIDKTLRVDSHLSDDDSCHWRYRVGVSWTLQHRSTITTTIISNNNVNGTTRAPPYCIWYMTNT